MSDVRKKLSAVVVAYNRAALIRTCLKALCFADEIIVVDKSSTDGTATVAAGYADRVVHVPWSPTVEETRHFAVTLCAHEWVLLLDDDECLSPEAALFIDLELRAPRADIYRFPLRHYVMGVHDERAYYWPESHIRLFRRGSIAFPATVHGGMELLSDSLFEVPVEGGACIHHLSHADSAQWLEKTNRYTSRPDRQRGEFDGKDIIAYAHARLDHWASRARTGDDFYVSATAALRAVYDIVDQIKAWEQQTGQDGTKAFAEHCRKLDARYEVELATIARHRP